MTNQVIYESAKETAKKIRVALKTNFPGVKFSVRSSIFAGGDSVDVSWTDGPLSEDVNAVIDQFKSGHFDGMQDMYVSGAYKYQGQLYNGAKYVMGQRKLSNEYRQQIKEYIVENYEDANENTWEYNRIFNEAEKEMIKNNQPEEVETVEEVKEVSTPVEVVTPEEITVTMNINEEKNGIEFSFTGIPSEATRKLLKENGFRWSKFSKIWYIKKSESTLLFAEGFVSAYNEYVEDRKAEKEAAQTNNIEAVTVVNELINKNENNEEVESILVNNSALVGRKVVGYWGAMHGWSYGEITSETIYNEVIVKWDDNEDGLTKSYYDIKDLKNNDTIDCIGIHLLPVEPNREQEPVKTKENKNAVVLDFNSKFKQRQEEKEAQEMQSRFLNNILPYMDQEDKTRLLEAAKDTDKFNEIFQEVLIKVSFKQALTDVKKG